jgi:protein-S-isoprenylcysteine O-methyltransferase Ste14
MVAMAVGAAGAAIALSCIFTFAAIGKGTPAPFDPPRRLIVRGPYRFVRNPMYLGLSFVLVGWAVCLLSPWALIGPLAFVLYINRFQIEPEERTLTALFGAAFTTYATKVRRWL